MDMHVLQVYLPQVAYLVLNERHVEHSGQLVLVRLDTPHKVRGLCGQIVNKSTNGYFELSSNSSRQSTDRSLRIS